MKLLIQIISHCRSLGLRLAALASAWARVKGKKALVPLYIALLGLSAGANAAVLNTIWYSGDGNLTNWGNMASGSYAITHYQPFTVTDAAGWDIRSIYSVGSYWSSGDASWEIRSGMSVGNGGTTLYSGKGSMTADLIDN